VVRDRDAFWDMKERGIVSNTGGFRGIHVPRNTGAGVVIGAFGLVLGFALVWHIWWVAGLSLAGMILTAIGHSFDSNRDYYVRADEVARIENLRAHLPMERA
jgi:cytochrome o ubiquinol oxidase subunit 1